MTKVEVPTKSGRLINAVARIGYDVEVALCDLMDNSIDAGATQINVIMSEQVQETEGQTDLVCSYLIADDGIGMDDQALIGAFTLGSDRDYPNGSLGKFGLGLKSAGLSLGNRIVLVSKTSNGTLTCAILSVEDIVTSGEYRIDLGEPPANLLTLWNEHTPNPDHGTLLYIDQPTESQPGYSAFVPYFKRYCSNIYHLFLSKKERLAIFVDGDPLTPIDPLFFNEASANGPLNSPMDWDGRTPRLLLEDQNLTLDEQTSCNIAATHLIHPPSFEKTGDNAEKRENYQIESDPYTRRPRHGFFVYRNRRIIVSAERFHGLISAQTAAWAFRGRLMFDETADDVLMIDVQKRHVRLPKSARNNLKSIIANYHTKSVEAWKSAGKRVSDWKALSKDEYANKSINATPVSDLDYAPGADLTSEEDIQDRRQLQAKVGSETLESIRDKKVTRDTLEKSAMNRDAVVPVEALKGNPMWLPYASVNLGRSETVINRSHSWIAEALALSESDPRISIVLYQILTILARAELEVRSTKWPGISEDVVNKVLDNFRRKAATIGEDLAESFADELRNVSNSEISED
jgi:hypothetical protein